jgi:hypothetical protein
MIIPISACYFSELHNAINSRLRYGKGFRGVHVISSISQGYNRNGIFFSPKMTIPRSFNPKNGIRDPKLVYIDNLD